MPHIAPADANNKGRETEWAGIFSLQMSASVRTERTATAGFSVDTGEGGSSIVCQRGQFRGAALQPPPPPCLLSKLGMEGAQGGALPPAFLGKLNASLSASDIAFLRRHCRACSHRAFPSWGLLRGVLCEGVPVSDRQSAAVSPHVAGLCDAFPAGPQEGQSEGPAPALSPRPPAPALTPVTPKGGSGSGRCPGSRCQAPGQHRLQLCPPGLGLAGRG